jgi:hypothetical protein
LGGAPTRGNPSRNDLRQSLIELAIAQASEGQQTKTEMVYQYSPARVSPAGATIVEAFFDARRSRSREEIDHEQWAKREEQIERVMQATVGMYGDSQVSLARRQEIEGLEMKAIGFDEKRI